MLKLVPSCNIECDFGNLFIKKIPEYPSGTFYMVLFVPNDQSLPGIQFTYERLSSNITSLSPWEYLSDILGSNYYELKRIISEAFKWLEFWRTTTNHTIDTYDFS